MKSNPLVPVEVFYIKDPRGVDEMVGSLTGDDNYEILDAKYQKKDLAQEIQQNSPQLILQQRKELWELLVKFEDLFDGTLGTWKDTKYNIELKEGTTPYHGRAYSIPKAYKRQVRLEVERLVKLKVLRKVNRSEWGAPTFVIPKKDRTIRFITNFRELNKRMKRKPYPLPNIQDLLLKLEGFTYATSLNSNMGYLSYRTDFQIVLLMHYCATMGQV